VQACRLAGAGRRWRCGRGRDGIATPTREETNVLLRLRRGVERGGTRGGGGGCRPAAARGRVLHAAARGRVRRPRYGARQRQRVPLRRGDGRRRGAHGGRQRERAAGHAAARGAGHARTAACGQQHTVAVTPVGGLRSWGAAEFGQLGHGPAAGIGIRTAPAASRQPRDALREPGVRHGPHAGAHRRRPRLHLRPAPLQALGHGDHANRRRAWRRCGRQASRRWRRGTTTARRWRSAAGCSRGAAASTAKRAARWP
jgi:hypothetical protein